MTSSESISSSERRRRRRAQRRREQEMATESDDESDSSAGDCSEDEDRRTVENNRSNKNKGGANSNEATEFTIYDNRHHEEYYDELQGEESAGESSYGTNHSYSSLDEGSIKLRQSLLARRKKLASMNSVGSLTDGGGSIEGGSLRESQSRRRLRKKKKKERSGSIASLDDGSLGGNSWKDIFNTSWTGSLTESLIKRAKKKKSKEKDKEKDKEKEKKKDRKKKKERGKKKSTKEKKSSSDKKSSTDLHHRRHRSKDEDHDDKKKRGKPKKDESRNISSKEKDLRRSTHKMEEKRKQKKRRDDDSSSESSLSSEFDASTMGSHSMVSSKKAYIYIDRNGRDERLGSLMDKSDRSGRRRITVDGSESDRSRTRQVYQSSRRRLSDGVLKDDDRAALQNLQSSKMNSDSVPHPYHGSGGPGVGMPPMGGTGNVVYYACDENTGMCAFHPDVQLRKRSRFGGWKDVLRQCPKCIQSAGAPSPVGDHRTSRENRHRREISDPKMSYSGRPRGDRGDDRGRHKGREDDHLRSASASMTRRRVHPDQSSRRREHSGSLNQYSSRAELTRQYHSAHFPQERKNAHYRTKSYDVESNSKQSHHHRAQSYSGNEKRQSSDVGRNPRRQNPNSFSRNSRDSQTSLRHQTSDKSKQFNSSEPVLERKRDSQLMEEAKARQRRRASDGETPIQRPKPSKVISEREPAPYSLKTPTNAYEPAHNRNARINSTEKQQQSTPTKPSSSFHDDGYTGNQSRHVHTSSEVRDFSEKEIRDVIEENEVVKNSFTESSGQKPNGSLSAKEELKSFAFNLSSGGARANSFSEDYTRQDKIRVPKHAKSFDNVPLPGRHQRSTLTASKMSSVKEESVGLIEPIEKNIPEQLKQSSQVSFDDSNYSSGQSRSASTLENVVGSMSGVDGSPAKPKPKIAVTNLEWAVKGFSGLYSGEVNMNFEPHGAGELALADGIVIKMKWVNGYPVKDDDEEKPEADEQREESKSAIQYSIPEDRSRSDELEEEGKFATQQNISEQNTRVEELDVHVAEKISKESERNGEGDNAAEFHTGGDQEESKGDESIPSYSVGDEGRRRDMIKDNDKDVALMRIASLQPNDNAFIRRTNGSWSFAEVRKVTADTIVFFVNPKGATKAYVQKYWTTHVRVPKVGVQATFKLNDLDGISHKSDKQDSERNAEDDREAPKMNRFSVANLRSKGDEEPVKEEKPAGILRMGRSFADRNCDRKGHRRRRSVSFSPIRSEYEISSHTGETDEEDIDSVSFQRYVTIDDSLAASGGYDLRGVEP